MINHKFTIIFCKYIHTDSEIYNEKPLDLSSTNNDSSEDSLSDAGTYVKKC